MSALSNIQASIAGQAVEFAAETIEAHGFGKNDLVASNNAQLSPTPVVARQAAPAVTHS